MGEVYLGWDAELHRRVALKVLPAVVTSDQQRMTRLMQEAQAASALNHPNIITIYDVEVANGPYLIAMEFVEGVTLRERLAKGPPPDVAEVLDTAAQIAGALSTAHGAGIVHRDIRPENIMLRQDGYVKVLDFGLAKLTQDETQEQTGEQTCDPQAPTLAMRVTDPSAVRGTLAYMSPEQSRGMTVNARSDVWSLGIVIHEMATGRVPFAGTTFVDLIVSINERTPLRLDRQASEMPAELEAIVVKALMKDEKERYQSAGELLTDLRRLQRRCGHNLPAQLLHDSAEPTKIINPEQSSIGARTSNRAGTEEMPISRQTISTKSLWAGARRQKQLVVLIIAILTVAAGGVVVLNRGGLGLRLRGPAKLSLSHQNANIAKLTSTGKATEAAISPDKTHVVYVSDDAGRQSLWIKHVATASNVQIVAPAEVWYQGLTFSRDGNYIYFVRYENQKPLGVLYEVPLLGGVPKNLKNHLDSPITFSPDGKHFAFVRNFETKGEHAIVIAEQDGPGERILSVRKLPQFYSLRGPSWSPDGKSIACGAGSYAGGLHSSVVAIDVASGAEKQVTEQNWRSVEQVAWLAGGEGLVAVAESQLWRITPRNGERQKVTNDLSAYSSLSVSADSNALITVQKSRSSSTWLAPNGKEATAREVSQVNYDSYYGINWSPDGRLVFTSRESGHHEIWIMDADGGRKKRLTVNGVSSRDPTVSPDGRYVVFASNQGQLWDIWRIGIDGKDAQQLTTGGGKLKPYCSPDGRWVVYTSNETGKNTLWKVPIDGGDPEQLTDEETDSPAVSPDGRMVACYYLDDESPNHWSIMVLPLSGGEARKFFRIPLTVNRIAGLRWTFDGSAVTYVENRGGVSNIMSQPLKKGPAQQVTDFKSGQIFRFDWSRDGRQLALSRGSVSNDVVLITGK